MTPTHDCTKAVLTSLKKLLASDTLGIDEIVESPECQKFSKTEIDNCLEYLNEYNFIIAKFINADDQIHDVTECKITRKGYELLKK